MTAWKELYDSKLTNAQQAVRLIKSGARILISTGCAQPQTLIEELVREETEIYDAEIYTLFPLGPAPYINEKFSKKFRVCSFFISQSIREGINQRYGDYIPVSMSEIPFLFKSGKIPLHTVLIQTSPPDSNGQLSLGISVDIVKSAVENSLTAIAEVNKNMPITSGDSSIPIEMVDAIVESDRPVLEYSFNTDDPVCDTIARNVASLIDDGSTVEFGIGAIPQAVFRYLDKKKDIGVHTEFFSDGIIPLIENGVITGRRKGLNRGKIVASSCAGSKKLYDYINGNPLFDFRPSEYVNDLFIISQNHKMVSVNSALEVDITGQVCSDSIGYEFFSGVGGQADFTRGAARAKDGKSIIALPSTAKNGSVSRIVPSLSEGAGTVVTRSDVHYVVTEYGIADLFGKSIRERVLALTEIAHPDFRNELLKTAKIHNYIFPYQKELPVESLRYLREYETTRTLSEGTELFFRPIRPTDAKELRDMFYSLSEQSIAFRFYEQIKAFPHKFIQDFTAIDFSKDMAIAATVQDLGGEQIIGIAQYNLDPATKRAEVSFLVRDDWQAKGVGTILLEILTDIARKRGVVGFNAKVLVQNQLMLGVFYNSGFKITTKKEDDLYQISYNFRKE
ncbi:MAG TPA: GNAT family N-acetyltransferase [Chitinispirillaceae bacterium]|nr:GNAT family N-acetyltransferase [Chitinispirillaceae bacterium]